MGVFGDLFATYFNRRNHVFCTLRTVFKNFSIFPRSLSCPFISLTNSPCFSKKSTIFFIISTSNFKKRYEFSIFLKVFHVYSLWFLFFWVVVEIWKMWCSNMGWVYCVEFVIWVLLILIIWCLIYMFSWLLLIFEYDTWSELCCACHTHGKMSHRHFLVILWIS